MSRRLLLGGEDAVLRLAKSSYDAGTTDPSKLIFSEKYKTLHIMSRLTFMSNTMTATVGARRVLTHTNFGYYPLIQFSPTRAAGQYGVYYPISITDRTLSAIEFFCNSFSYNVFPMTVIFFVEAVGS